MKQKDLFPPSIFSPLRNSDLNKFWKKNNGNSKSQERWGLLNSELCWEVYKKLNNKKLSAQKFLELIAAGRKNIAEQQGDKDSESMGSPNIRMDGESEDSCPETPVLEDSIGGANRYADMYPYLEKKFYTLINKKDYKNYEKINEEIPERRFGNFAMSAEAEYHSLGFELIIDTKQTLTRVFINDTTNNKYKIPYEYDEDKKQEFMKDKTFLVICHPRWGSQEEYNEAFSVMEELYKKILSGDHEEPEEIIALLGEFFWEGCNRLLWERGTCSIMTDAVYVLMAICGLQPASILTNIITPDFEAFLTPDKQEFAKNFRSCFKTIKTMDITINEDKKEKYSIFNLFSSVNCCYFLSEDTEEQKRLLPKQ